MATVELHETVYERMARLAAEKKTKTAPEPVAIQTLAEQIGVLHANIEIDADHLARRYVEMFNLLTQAKKDAGDGGWLRWLTDNREVLGFGERQARLYLREPEARASDKARHAEGEKKRRAKKQAAVQRAAEPPVHPRVEVKFHDEVIEVKAPAKKVIEFPNHEGGLDAYFARLLDVTKVLIPEIKRTVKTRAPVIPEAYENAVKAVEKLTEALDTIAPRWQCDTCSRVLDPDIDFEDEPPTRYECGECGEKSRENRCEQCNKFSARETPTACIDEECEGEMNLVGWESVIDTLAAQNEKAAEQARKKEEKAKAAEAFAKTKEGKAQAAKEAAEKEAEEAEYQREHEDEVLQQANLIIRARAEGKTVEEVKREIRREEQVDHVITRYLEQEASGDGIGSHYVNEVKKFTKAEMARLSEARIARGEAAPWAEAERMKGTT